MLCLLSLSFSRHCRCKNPERNPRPIESVDHGSVDRILHEKFLSDVPGFCTNDPMVGIFPGSVGVFVIFSQSVGRVGVSCNIIILRYIEQLLNCHFGSKIPHFGGGEDTGIALHEFGQIANRKPWKI